MKNIKKLSVLLLMLCSLSLFAFDCQKARQYALDSIENFPESVERIISREKSNRLAELFAKDPESIVLTRTGKHEVGVEKCVAKYNYQAALGWLAAKTQEEKDASINNAQKGAIVCIEQFDAFRAYNVGHTQFGSDMLDKLANLNFKA
jgi:hypothetical protein